MDVLTYLRTKSSGEIDTSSAESSTESNVDTSTQELATASSDGNNTTTQTYDAQALSIASYLVSKSTTATDEDQGVADEREWLDKATLESLADVPLSDIEQHLLGGYISMISVPDLAITSIDQISAYGLDGTPRWIMDEIQDGTISNTQEKEDITGKQGRKISSLKRNKAATVSATNGLVSAGLLESQVGSEFTESEGATVRWTDYLVVNSNAATTNYKAAGETGAEIIAVYVRNLDGSTGKKLTQAAATAADKFTYTPDSKALAFNAGDIADGTEIVVFYDRKIPAAVLVNESDKYSEILQIYVDCSAEDKCGNVFHAQFYFPKADVSGEFELAMGDSQTVHAFEAEALAGSCGAGGQLWTYTVFGVNAEDAA